MSPYRVSEFSTAVLADPRRNAFIHLSCVNGRCIPGKPPRESTGDQGRERPDNEEVVGLLPMGGTSRHRTARIMLRLWGSAAGRLLDQRAFQRGFTDQRWREQLLPQITRWLPASSVAATMASRQAPGPGWNVAVRRGLRVVMLLLSSGSHTARPCSGNLFTSRVHRLGLPITHSQVIVRPGETRRSEIEIQFSEIPWRRRLGPARIDHWRSKPREPNPGFLIRFLGHGSVVRQCDGRPWAASQDE